MFSGSMVAIVTPFDSRGKFAEESYRQLIDFQIENGTDVIVPCGTTGESATLDFEEHEYVIKVCIEQVNKRVPVIADHADLAEHRELHPVGGRAEFEDLFVTSMQAHKEYEARRAQYEEIED